MGYKVYDILEDTSLHFYKCPLKCTLCNKDVYICIYIYSHLEMLFNYRIPLCNLIKIHKHTWFHMIISVAWILKANHQLLPLILLFKSFVICCLNFIASWGKEIFYYNFPDGQHYINQRSKHLCLGYCQASSLLLRSSYNRVTSGRTE